VLAPRRMPLKAAFTPRGGITTTVTAEYEAAGVMGQDSGDVDEYASR
jgi:NADPH-dependent 7-cyano-7-deazaguanine reductase QueF